MAPSQVSGMKMRNLLFGVILGLLAVVHSTPANIVTQDEVYREAVTDGYLIDHLFLNSLTTESPKRTVTVQASQQPSSESKESDMIEGSGDTNDKFTTSVFLQHGSKRYATTTQSVSHGQSFQQPSSESKESDMIEGSGDTNDRFTTSVFLQHGSKRDATTTQSVSHAQSSTSQVLPRDIEGSGSDDLGSTDRQIIHQDPTSSSMTSISTTETSTTSSTSKAAVVREMAPRLIEESEGSGSEPILVFKAPRQNTVQEPQKVEPVPQGTEGRTPGWIIIVAFIVGIAALVMLCVAIATRDKWNSPKQTSQPEAKANSSSQQRELEMETFLHKDHPTENGQTDEYTVIPLEELPENYSSH